MILSSEADFVRLAEYMQKQPRFCSDIGPYDCNKCPWDWLEGYIPKEVFIGPLPKPWYKCTSIRPGSDIIINLRGAS